MSSNDFETVHVIDDRLKFNDKVAYAVKTGAASNTSVTFNAQSQSVNSQSYQIAVPSKETVIDRRVLWKSTVILKVVMTPDNGQYPIQWGDTVAFGCYPLHQLTSTMSCQINSNNVSVNTADILASVLKINDRASLQSYNGTTASYPDGSYYEYKDALNDTGGGVWTSSANNPLGSYNVSSYDDNFVPRGSYALDAVGINYDPATGSVTGVQPIGAGLAQRTVYLKFTLIEPLVCLSPWTFNSESNSSGLYGVTNLNFVFNMDASNKCRAIRFNGLAIPNKASIASTQVMQYIDSSLTFNFLTPQPTQLLPLKCIVPYYECPRYLTACPEIAPNSTRTVVLNTISLNNIPDKLIIFCRKPLSDCNSTDSDSFLVIKAISLNFNNTSGLLSGTTQNELYRISKRNGYNGNWLEFSGYANKNVTNTNLQAGQLKVPTGGSVLMLDFATDIQLPSYLSAGSIGNFNLQFSLSVENQSYSAISPELVVITVNSGVFITQNGSSSIYTGLLNREDVLNASQQVPVGHADIRRLVGNGFLDKLKSIGSMAFRGIKKLAPIVAPIAKQYLASSGSPLGEVASQAIGALGYGRSGGALRRKVRK